MHKLMTSDQQCLPNNSDSTDCFALNISLPVHKALTELQRAHVI